MAWRGWHTIVRFVPMVALGVLFLVIASLGHFAPHTSQGFIDALFVLSGVLLIVFAFIGMAFTRCPTCSRSTWIVCLQESDMRHDRRENAFYRELTPPEEET
jgi:amino acid transporter